MATLVKDHLEIEEENQSMQSFIGQAYNVVRAARTEKEEMASELS